MIISLDESSNDPQYNIVFRHEKYHIWESPAKGFLLQTNDFLHFCKDGIWLCNLAKVDKGDDGQDTDRYK